MRVHQRMCLQENNIGIWFHFLWLKSNFQEIFFNC